MNQLGASRFKGVLFDGRFAKARPAYLILSGSTLSFELIDSPPAESAFYTAYPLREVRLSEKVENVPRVIETSDGLRFETTDPLLESALTSRAQPVLTHHWSPFRRIENSWRLAIGSAIAMTAFIVYSYLVLIPRYSVELASRVPQKVRRLLSASAHTLMKLDERDPAAVLSETAKSRFEDALNDLRINVRVIEFNRLPNAFMLPDGSAYISVRLLEMAQSSDEILAVLLHEQGHHVLDHVIQNLIESSSISALIILITGGTEWTNVPLLLLSSNYSRLHESQADDYAVLKLKEKGKDPRVLANILERMAGGLPPEVDSFDVLSSHPSFKERIARIRAVQAN